MLHGGELDVLGWQEGKWVWSLRKHLHREGKANLWQCGLPFVPHPKQESKLSFCILGKVPQLDCE